MSHTIINAAILNARTAGMVADNAARAMRGEYPCWTSEDFEREIEHSGLEDAPLPAEQPSNPVALTDAVILADETLRYHYGLNGGAGPVSEKGWEIINAVARIVGQQTKGGGKC